MGKILLDVEDGRVIKVHTEGMKPKKLTKLEKLRRAMTRKRSIKQAWQKFNAPIVQPKLGE